MTSTSSLSGAASTAVPKPAWAPRRKPDSGADPTAATFQPAGQDSTGSSADLTDLGALLSQLTSGGKAGATSVNAKSTAQAQSALLSLQEQSQGGTAGAHRGHHGHHKPPQGATGADPSTAAPAAITGATAASGADAASATEPSDAGTQLSAWLSQQASAKAS